MSYLGLDIGTSGCKALVFDEAGREIAAAYREYPLLSPVEGWAELDSDGVCSRCFEVIREASQKAADQPVKAMGISSQGEAFTTVDERGNLLGNGMVSSDARAASLVRDSGLLISYLVPERLWKIAEPKNRPEQRWERASFSTCPRAWTRKNSELCLNCCCLYFLSAPPPSPRNWPLSIGRIRWFISMAICRSLRIRPRT